MEEIHIQEILDAAPFGAHYYELQPDGSLVLQGANRTAEKILGFDHRPLIGSPIEKAFPALGSTEIANAYRCVAQTGARYQNYHLIHFNPKVHGIFEVHAIPIGPNCTAVFFSDITQRQRSEDELRKLRKAVETADEVIFLTDREGTITYVNPAFTKLYGYSAVEVVGKVTPHLLESGTLPREHYEEIWRTLLAKNVVRGESVNRTKDGKLITVEGSASPVLDEEGSITGFLSIQRDVSERKLTEERLRDQATLLGKAQDAIFVRTLDGTIAFWNQGAERLYGWTAEEAIGRNADDVLFGSERMQESIKAHQIVLEKGEWEGELHQISRGKHEVVVQSRWTLVRDDESRPKSVLLINTDITEKKKLQTQFLRAQRMESIGTLAGGIAHDLNNVLAPIVLGLEALRRKTSDPMDLKLLETMSMSALRGTELIKQVLSFARGVDGERMVVPVRYVLSELDKICRETFPKSIEVVRTASKELWSTSGNATQLHQLFMNICVNARDAMPNGGRLEIKAENLFLDEQYTRMHLEAKVGPHVLVSFTDSGIGMPPGVMDKIFEPFFTTKELGQGTGLGLSTVMAIVKTHGGFVNVYSEVGKGSTFKVYLPASSSSVKEEPHREPADYPLGSGEIVLIVDDEAGIREITKSTLESSGYVVLTALDGTDAVATYARRGKDIAVVLTDMMMPYMDGTSTIRALRKMNPHVKVIAASGLGQSGGALAASDLNHVRFLQKPYTSERLLRAIHDTLHFD